MKCWGETSLRVCQTNLISKERQKQIRQQRKQKHEQRAFMLNVLSNCGKTEKAKSWLEIAAAG